MFKDHETGSDRARGENPAVDLSHDQILDSDADDAPSAPQKRRRNPSSLADAYGNWRSGVSAKLAKADLTPDLAQDIGSRRWLRGAATLAGLTALTLAFLPGFSPVSAAPAMQMDDHVRDEFRSQMIMPLALGADSGRRMGATPAVIELASAPERPRLDLVATLAQGDGFDRMLRRAGVAGEEASLIAGMIGEAIPIADIEPGTQIDITLGRRPAAGAPRPVDALTFRARFDLQLAVERVDGQLRLDPRPIVVDATPLRVRGDVGSSLYRSARAAGAPPGAVQDFLRTLGEEMNLNAEIGADDEFDMIVEYRRAATGEVEVGDLLYAAIIRDGRPRKQLMRFGREGQFYDAAGEGTMREGLIRPVSGAISSRYGMRRHPILGYRRMHGGVDFRGRTGTPIYAATDGTVNFAGRNGGFGNFVRIRHGGGLSTGYAHMSRIAVQNGQRVERGQVIGYIGSTGLSTGPHLHYEMYRNGQKIDPLSVQWVTRAQLTAAEMANFRQQLVRLQMIEPGAALNDLAPDTSTVEEPVREIDRIENRQRVD
ncbi:M23 family metallopeptidase [Aurantiacibacter gangjinensis]|uniref:Membrane protein n=1 Tax=Aurantiacibacter gangjinensis TaxID=502682 RepID=A0A0G9MNC8_9SPHN|nr:M23 family metallopeptidase [Aurantiacibacter gangjinensis]APE27536.1 Membrane proteins related to metalloendopeptidase [Aurantiacibacter gangjinensis]KLE32200.1 membrane protein [Aurantiacibacter gangjinensis]